MHELGIARDLLKRIKEEIGDKKPSRIVIVVGGASGIDEDFLRHSFIEHIFPEMCWNDVELVFEKEVPRLRCKNCKEVIKELNFLSCPDCNSVDVEIIGGDRTYLKTVS